MFNTIKELVTQSQLQKQPLWQTMLDSEQQATKQQASEIWQQMQARYQVMKTAIERGSQGKGVHSPTGLTGGEAVKLKNYRETHQTLSGSTFLMAVQAAVATNEVNASMGVICATPTAGSSGTVPGVLFYLRDRLQLSQQQCLQFLLTTGAIGLVIANNAMIAGAAGGCQAEVGSAAAMAAAAAVEAAGGTPQQSSEAIAIALSNLLGLVCDPVAGLVEIPCVKRNAIGTTDALVAADMALAGCTSKIPADEVIAAMADIGRQMPKQLRETGLGGLAATPTGKKIKMQIFGKKFPADL
ncbi:L-serine ammonia-lyase, iron-sulfur-dependent, subunit alpha [Liquorilactobacillus ghanensis]|uniref:L-serine ammonia-lyase, iron-sulfur-dependent, subunit alpha n=1 Tax=Liquorilactobacillus ghanensis TaxID=399370 RepID=UPI0039E7EA68